MTENQAISIIQSYIQHHGYTPIRINPNKILQGKKSPDLEVQENSKLAFYGEVKTPDLKPNDKTHMFHWITTHSKLRDFIHKAVKQLKDHDSGHTVPWVVFFTSSHFQLNWTNFAHCIQGAVVYNENTIKDLNNTRFIKETNEDVKEIDLFVWCQVNQQEMKIYQMVHFVNAGSALFEATKVVNEKLTPFPIEGILDRNSKTYG